VFVVTEIEKRIPISDFYVPTVHPFVVSFKFYYGAANEDIATWWSGAPFSVTEPLTEQTTIIGVVYNVTINYTIKTSLIDCIANSQSYYWDAANQILYIHYNDLHQLDYININFSYGISIGLTNDKVRYFDNRIFKPFLRSFPLIETSVDKFNYDQLTFVVDTLIFDNRLEFFNQFKTTAIYNNKVIIKTGEDGDEYTDLTERAVYFVEDYNFSATEFTIDIQDFRKLVTAQIPDKLFNITDYPDIGDSSIGKPIPFGYGPLHDVPGLCINEEAISGSVYPDFIFTEIIIGSVDTDMDVYVEIDDAWVLQLEANYDVNWSTGVVTINNARAVSGSSYGFKKVKADFNGFTNTYASDIIKDMNDRFLSISYDSSSYDMTEWELEEVFLKPISLYMDKVKNIYEWVKDMQSLSSVGFRYTNTVDNKYTIRIDNPNRAIAATIQQIRIKNPETVQAESNVEEVYNKIYVGYNKSIIEKTANKVEDTTYLDISKVEYGVIIPYDKISGLELIADATNKAAIQAEDYYKIRQVFQMELIGEEYLDLRIYDTLDVYLTLYKKKFSINTAYIEVIEENIFLEVLSSDIIYDEGLAPIITEDVGDEYFGLIHGQIISKTPNYELKTNTIRLRERPYSDIWEGIYGV